MRQDWTRWLVSALALGCMGLGVIMIFFPDELSGRLAPAQPPAVTVALVGAALFGFGILNWLSRHSTLGGIYGRPFVVGNLAHFVSGAPPLVRTIVADPANHGWLWPLATIYVAGALLYGFLMIRNPLRSATSADGVR